jgi:hypothetical protein
MKAKTANIAKVGNSYRVRVQRNGKRVSQSFTSLKKAYEARKKLTS